MVKVKKLCDKHLETCLKHISFVWSC